MTRLSWTQPVCVGCWTARQGPQTPVRIREDHAGEETCCDCGEKTRSGIYIRVDPKTVAYPMAAV